MKNLFDLLAPARMLQGCRYTINTKIFCLTRETQLKTLDFKNMSIYPCFFCIWEVRIIKIPLLHIKHPH